MMPADSAEPGAYVPAIQFFRLLIALLASCLLIQCCDIDLQQADVSFKGTLIEIR